AGNYAEASYSYIDKENKTLDLVTWIENGKGAVESDTGEQKRELDFYEEAIAAARNYLQNKDGDLNITVSGHSAGGNHAQYVTSVYKNQMGNNYKEVNDIDRCVSFDGQDTIDNYDYFGWRNDKIVFGEGIKPEDIRAERIGNDLVLQNRNRAGDVVTIKNAYQSNAYFIEQVTFTDGTVWNCDEIKKIADFTASDTVTGGVSDTAYAYDFTKSEGIYDMGGNDVIKLGAAMLDILFEKSGNDLVISDGSDMPGTEDAGKLTIRDWYASDSHKIENLYSSDGYSITDSQVQLLIDCMASFGGEGQVSSGENITMYPEERTQSMMQFWRKEG
ncbi:MAG: hypothetical protein K2N34_13255, partial [Lachnospiraceae bacterium]|nr:hypothetical protein [Lachnospiraceae bacterium]